MEFRLTEERRMLQDSLRRFLAESVTPARIAATTDDAAGHDPDLWRRLTDLGLPGAMVSEARGGFGGDGFDLMVVFEELGRAGLPTPLLDSAVLAGGLLAETGRDDLLARVIEGQVIAFAHAEPGSRYDLSRVATRAQRRADGWHVAGHKAVVHAAPAAEALIVSARTGGAVADEDGLSLFLVPRDAVTMRDYPLQGGGRAAEVHVDATLPADALLMPEGTALAAIERAQARATAAQCAEALGLMEAIKTLTVDYLRTRKQFGQPIGKFQALQHRMADVLIEIEQARSAVINLCGHMDAERPLRERHVSATKNLVGRAARLVVEESIQMHGGIGMTRDYALGHLAKRLTMVDHRFGDADFHLERFVALGAA
ncbi:acyl-CoA dehydrogenase family protein [Thetidibacter halocola]|uniref:Acyl-CoA dehydrogenase family protein n=1 Tax=Thetidibacter halocola TaxID=2827239 RepID=A0A8J7WDH7_9RHOB|nr:acyl-CoA dehydrogenase [Thetidibacter halocola]MBS0123696.1 acyl-CoA dehydrogenase family protein [Thetidibacter halocola]